MPDASFPAIPAPLTPIQPQRDCPLCPRLAEVRQAVAAEYPGWWNAPVPPFGDEDAWLAIVGLAPGKHGAHRTGRPFTGDGAGPLLYGTLAKFGLAEGQFDARVDDGVTLTGAVILNAVKCLPPENKPTPDEIRTCRPFLTQELAALPKLSVVIALGQIAHQSAVKALGGKLPKTRFAHLAEHRMPSGMVVLDSYHCSRYNQNTGRLTPEMFEAVFARALELRD
ncbi:uracil-DNA glycosylase [uncultured Sphingomonas sp.]|uniref:uracil-DNA glycosylase n=1 Tax=uncultured Sphingomonas sp. TaxID=158754 RepID=UPI003749937B